MTGIICISLSVVLLLGSVACAVAGTRLLSRPPFPLWRLSVDGAEIATVPVTAYEPHFTVTMIADWKEHRYVLENDVGVHREGYATLYLPDTDTPFQWLTITSVAP
jgi:hypothetical protein